MDEFFFPHCQWAADYHERARIEEVVLIYFGLKVPVVQAFGMSERFAGLMDELIDLLPEKFFCHYQEKYRTKFLGRYNERSLGDFIKMELKDGSNINSIGEFNMTDVIRLTDTHVEMIKQLYEIAYPEGYFDRQMLKSNLYFGYIVDNELLSIAGVHVDSQEFGVTALGNIATHPEHRGKGLAKAVTARLLNDIVKKRDVITLNVNTKNIAAINCYKNLGFEKTHEYCEGLFTLKSN